MLMPNPSCKLASLEESACAASINLTQPCTKSSSRWLAMTQRKLPSDEICFPGRLARILGERQNQRVLARHLYHAAHPVSLDPGADLARGESSAHPLYCRGRSIRHPGPGDRIPTRIYLPAEGPGSVT